MKKRDYWNRKALFETGADYMICFGQNCAGKSYQGKCECIERALRGEKFFFIRRWQSDINQKIATEYFDDMPVEKLTDGQWEGIKAWQGDYFFYNVNEEGKEEKSPCIGHYGDLNEWQRYKSRTIVNCTFVLFEEFITDGVYLDDEPAKLLKFRTIVFRDHPGQILMLGNSISRTVPYFYEWNLKGVIKQQQGTIELYHMKDLDDEGKEVLIAVEFGGHIKGTGSGFFGEAAKTIVTGEWDVKNYPRLPKPYIMYEMVYELAIYYQAFNFMLQLLVDPTEGQRLLYVYPKTSSRKVKRMITDQFSTDIMVTRFFNDNKAEKFMVECIDNQRVVYSDNVTATDFLSVVEQMDL